MNRKSLINDKENKTNTPRRSFGSQRQVLNTSGFLKTTDKEDIGGLNDKLSDYIDYVRSVEQINESLKSETQSIKLTYGSEIDSLRKALDDVTRVKTTIEYEKNSLIDENEKLKNKLKDKANSLLDLKQEYSELKDNIIHYRKKVDNYESLKLEKDEIVVSNNNLSTSLKHETFKRIELENKLITLTEEVEFLKKVNNDSVHNSMNKSSNFNKSENMDIRIAEEIEIARRELSEEFEVYKNDLKMMYEEKFDNLSKLNEKSVIKSNSVYNELVTARRQVDELHNEIHERDVQISNLKNRVATNTDLIDKINKDHDRYVADIIEDNSMLRAELEAKVTELTTITNEKIDIEKEFYMFRSLLENEQSRYQIYDSTVSPKRKLTGGSVDMMFDLVTTATGPIKLLCSENYTGECVYVINESANDVDLNEWKFEMIADQERVEYRFPQKLVTRGSSLTIWGSHQDGTVTHSDSETEHGMNVPLLVGDHVNCTLNDDMDGFVASFELNRLQSRRKVLRANVKKSNPQACSLM